MQAIKFSLPATVLREEKDFIVYASALGMSSAGETFKEAKRNFQGAVLIFFEEVLVRGTLADALTKLGWKKKRDTLAPPI